MVHGRYIDILDNIEGRVQRYYYKREPRQLIPQLIPNDSLNSIVRSQDRCGSDLFIIQSGFSFQSSTESARIIMLLPMSLQKVAWTSLMAWTELTRGT